MIKFEKVPKEQFMEDMKKNFKLMKEHEIENAYDSIVLPKRATAGSAGYDFYAPVNIKIDKNESKVIPTGIRFVTDENVGLYICPRSGHGFKQGIHLANTLGIIDSDYHLSDNSGHIMIKIVNDSAISNETFMVEAGKGFAQGLLTRYELTDDDNAAGIRNGGFGSTTNT